MPKNEGALDLIDVPTTKARTWVHSTGRIRCLNENDFLQRMKELNSSRKSGDNMNTPFLNHVLRRVVTEINKIENCLV